LGPQQAPSATSGGGIKGLAVELSDDSANGIGVIVFWGSGFKGFSVKA